MVRHQPALGRRRVVAVSVAVDQPVRRLFALVSEALAGATLGLLHQDRGVGQCVVDDDQAIDELTAQVEQSNWEGISRDSPDLDSLRYAVGILLILPELERSADLAEHIAQRALTDIGAEMTQVSRRIMQRISEVAARDVERRGQRLRGTGRSRRRARRGRRGT